MEGRRRRGAVVTGEPRRRAKVFVPPRSPLPPASPARVAGTPKKTPFIDMLTGGSALREAVDAGDDQKMESVLAEWECQLERFADIRRGFLLYD